MHCPDCRNEISGEGICPVCAGVSNSRPTMIGLGSSGPGFFCRQCGAHNGGAWSSCAACGAPAPGINQASTWMAGLLIGLIAALAGITAWRLSQPPVLMETPAVYEVAPIPAEQTNIVIRSSIFTPGQDRWQMTAITQSGGTTEITRSGGMTVVVSQDQNGSTTRVEAPSDEPQAATAPVVAAPTDQPQAVEGQAVQSQTEIVSSPPAQGATINQ